MLITKVMVKTDIGVKMKVRVKIAELGTLRKINKSWVRDSFAD